MEEFFMKDQAHVFGESGGGRYLFLPGQGNGQPVTLAENGLKAGFPQEAFRPVEIGHLEETAILLNPLQFHLGFGYRFIPFGIKLLQVVEAQRLHRVHLQDTVHHHRKFLPGIHVNVLHAGREEEH